MITTTNEQEIQDIKETVEKFIEIMMIKLADLKEKTGNDYNLNMYATNDGYGCLTLYAVNENHFDAIVSSSFFDEWKDNKLFSGQYN